MLAHSVTTSNNVLLMTRKFISIMSRTMLGYIGDGQFPVYDAL